MNLHAARLHHDRHPGQVDRAARFAATRRRSHCLLGQGLRRSGADFLGARRSSCSRRCCSTATSSARRCASVGDNPDSAGRWGSTSTRCASRPSSFMGLGAALAGIFSTMVNFTWWPTTGDGYLLPAIASVFVGGTPTWGGVGTVAGGAIGALIVSFIQSGIVARGPERLLRPVLQRPHHHPVPARAPLEPEAVSIDRQCVPVSAPVPAELRRINPVNKGRVHRNENGWMTAVAKFAGDQRSRRKIGYESAMNFGRIVRAASAAPRRGLRKNRPERSRFI